MKTKTMIKTALATLLCTAFPLLADAHTMTVDDTTFLVREVPHYSNVYAGPGTKLEKFSNVLGDDKTVEDNVFDFLRVVHYKYTGYGMEFMARTGKDDTRPADELGLSYYKITSHYHPLRCGLGVGSTLQQFIDKFGQPDFSHDLRSLDDYPQDTPIMNAPYRTYYYDLGGREFSITVDNKQTHKPVVAYSMTTEV